MHLAQIVNRVLDGQYVTPWTVGHVPADDLEEILYQVKARADLAEIEAKKRKR